MPRDDYLTSGEYSFVYLITDQKAVRSDASFGQHDGGFVEVLSGLQPGDKIIAGSYEEFKDQREISIIPDGGRKIN